MPFYANAKTSESDAVWRYIITAPSMEVLDEWYRALQDLKGKEALTRHSPEFYVFDRSKIPDLGRCTAPGNLVPQFMNKLIFTLCDDVGGRQWHPFWNGNVVDHKSGNTFYIRSKSDPRVFWDEYQGKIYASQQGRTRFVITNRDKKYDGSVMIGSDSIWISPVRDKNYLVSVGNDRGLILDRNGSEFSFGDLKDSFLSSGDVGSARVVKDRNNGEEWELVA